MYKQTRHLREINGMCKVFGRPPVKMLPETYADLLKLVLPPQKALYKRRCSTREAISATGFSCLLPRVAKALAAATDGTWEVFPKKDTFPETYAVMRGSALYTFSPSLEDFIWELAYAAHLAGKL